MTILLARYACEICLTEWPIVESVHVSDEFPEGIPSFRWEKCPDHPDAKGLLIPFPLDTAEPGGDD